MKSSPHNLEGILTDVWQHAFDKVCPMSMNRKERRTNNGRVIVAAATTAANEAVQRYNELLEK
jgi:hypothetical protein